MPSSRILPATFEQVLYFADGPQVVLLRMPGKSFIIGVRIDRVRDGAEYLGSRITEKMLDAYLRNRCDLRFVIAYPDTSKHYLFELPSDGDRVTLASFEFSLAKDEALLPDHHFFASDHTEECLIGRTGFNTVQRFLVDGKWDVQEFSKFNRSLSDIYALSRSVEQYADDSVPVDRRRAIAESFVKPWRGGGSYLAFFGEITRAGGRANKPEVDAIQWASPGYMDFLGDGQSFQKVNQILSHYDAHKVTIDHGYDSLWKYLSEMRLLKANRKTFDRKSPIAGEVNDRAKKFSRMLNLLPYGTLKRISGGDPLVAAKVLLASARRLKKMHLFFLQGRISLEGRAIG